jgi:hydroxymethylbilane synthase
MTARLATHPDVSERTPEVLERLVAAGVDVEFVGAEFGGGGRPRADADCDPLLGVGDHTLDLALVGIRALRSSEADDLTTVAVLPRLEPRDVLVTLSGRGMPLVELPRGARVGLIGPRRRAFLAAHRPDLEPIELGRETLREVASARGDGADAASDGLRLDALIMSALDARAAGLVDATVEALDAKAWLPEPGQGALALVARHPIAEATALDHLPTRTALRAELALLDALDAPSDVPLGCLAQPSGRWIRLWAAAASRDGRRLVRSDLTGPLDEPEGLGAAVARQLEERGFGMVLAGAASG